METFSCASFIFWFTSDKLQGLLSGETGITESNKNQTSNMLPYNIACWSPCRQTDSFCYTFISPLASKPTSKKLNKITLNTRHSLVSDSWPLRRCSMATFNVIISALPSTISPLRPPPQRMRASFRWLTHKETNQGPVYWRPAAKRSTTDGLYLQGRLCTFGGWGKWIARIKKQTLAPNSAANGFLKCYTLCTHQSYKLIVRSIIC